MVALAAAVAVSWVEEALEGRKEGEEEEEEEEEGVGDAAEPPLVYGVLCILRPVCWCWCWCWWW
jgi:hypothetical protein